MHQYTPRTQTDPTVKWLLNERAALRGCVDVLDDRLRNLATRLARAQRVLDSLNEKVTEVQAMRQDTVCKVKALDAVMTATYPNINPGAGGSVRARTGKYGEEGGLKRYVLSLLENASPAVVCTGELARMAVSHFGITQYSNKQRIAFRKQVRRMLRKVPHLVQELPPQNSRNAHGWRWVGLPSLDTLRAEAEAREAADSTGSEMGGQRAGCHFGRA